MLITEKVPCGIRFLQKSDHACCDIDAMIAETTLVLSDSASDGIAGAAATFQNQAAGRQVCEEFLDAGDEGGVGGVGCFVFEAEIAPEVGGEGGVG